MLNIRNIKIQKKHRWLWLGGAALVLRIIYGIFPTFCEYSYSRGFFLGIRWFVDNTWGRFLPFAMLYVFFFMLITWAAWGIYKEIKNRKPERSWKQWRGKAALNFGNFLGGVIFFFMVLWGFNYARIPLETTMGMDARKLHFEELRAEADYISRRCVEARAEIPNIDTFEVSEKHFPEDLETEMRNCLVEVLKEYGYPTVGNVRGRQVYPGLLYGFNSSGVYMPFTGEGHIESALHILQKPFTIAHEMSHGYGFGDEGTCNFLGYLACMRSKNPAIRYSGHLNCWRYVFSEVDAEYYLANRPLIDRGMFNDLEGVHREMKKYFEFLPGLQELAYEAYLRMQGIEDGLQNYDRMVLMVAAMRRKGIEY